MRLQRHGVGAQHVWLRPLAQCRSGDRRNQRYVKNQFFARIDASKTVFLFLPQDWKKLFFEVSDLSNVSHFCMRQKLVFLFFQILGQKKKNQFLKYLSTLTKKSFWKYRWSRWSPGQRRPPPRLTLGTKKEDGLTAISNSPTSNAEVHWRECASTQNDVTISRTLIYDFFSRYPTLQHPSLCAPRKT